MTVGLASGTTAAPDTAAPAAPRRRFFGRTRSAAEVERDRLRVLAEARVLLERAAAVIRAGWAQDAFYLVRDRQDRVRPVSPFGLLLLSRSDVVGACLVGAVAHASADLDRRSRRAPAAAAVDALWAELVEWHGRPPADAFYDYAHPGARAARVRDLARWNDEPQRSRGEVLGLIDRAVSRTILDAVR